MKDFDLHVCVQLSTWVESLVLRVFYCKDLVLFDIC